MLETIIDGGPLMIPLLLCSVAVLAVLLDRGHAFYSYSKIDNRSLRADIMKLLEEGRITDALNLCANTPGPVSAVLLVGLQSYVKTSALTISTESIGNLVGKAMEDYTSHALQAVESRFNVLSTVGNAAPLFGMTGTVTGMIKSFGALAGHGALNAGIVGAGIAEALITTAAGLLIALGAVIPYNLFMAKTEKLSLEIEQTISEMVDFIILRSERKKAV